MSQGAEQVAATLNQRINNGDLEVPMLPETASKAVTLAQDPDSDAAQLAQLIQSDQSLAGHVMRIANSAAYTPNASLVSLQQAIARLGINMIAEIALAASINSKMFSAPGFEKWLDRVWRHALASALWSKEVSRAARRNVEASFLCGLLHTIGAPVVLQEVLEIAKSEGIVLDDEATLALVEQYQLQAGLAVVDKWGMPQVVRQVMECLGGSCSDSAAAEQANCVVCGAKFATHMLDSDSLSRDELINHPVLADVNLYRDEVETLLEKLDVVKSTMESMLS